MLDVERSPKPPPSESAPEMSESNARLNVLISLKSAVQGGEQALAWVTKYGAAIATTAASMAVFAAKQGIDLGSRITDLSNQAEIGTEAFQVLSAAAMDSGVSMEEVSKSAVKLRQNIQSAKEGNAGLVASLRTLNLTAAGLQALAPERQWELIAQRIAEATDRQAALNAASDLFGAKNLPKLIEMLKRLGVEGLDKVADSTKNIRLSDAQVKSLDDAGDRLNYIYQRMLLIAAVGTVNTIDAVDKWIDKKNTQTDPRTGVVSKIGVASPQSVGGESMDASIDAAGVENAADLTPNARKVFEGPSLAETTAAIAQRKQADEAEAAAAEVQKKAQQAALMAAAELAELDKKAAEFVAEKNKKDLEDSINNSAQKAKAQIDQGIAAEQAGIKKAQTDAIAAKAETQRLAQLSAENTLSRAIAASQQAIASLDANRFKTEAEKAPLRIALIQQENAAIQARIDLLVEENKTESDPAAKEIRKGKIDSLRSQQGTNNVRVESTQPLGVGGSLAAASNSYMDNVGTVADQVGRAWSSVGQSMSSSLGNAFSDMILKATSFKDAMAGFGNAILQSMVQAMAAMAADFIIQHTVMAAVRSIFHTKGVAEKAVATGAETAIHTGGEVAKTTATAAGATARTGIGLGETIMHGLQVAWRTATHIAGEVAKTASTILNAGIRIGTIIAESIAYVFQAAIGAMAAMASIPYVGPILAVLAAGAMVAGGMALVGNIGGFAEGGPVSGAGTGTSDSIPAWLSNGEYVMPAAMTAKYRPLLDSMRNGTLNPGQLAAAPGSGGGGGATLNSAVNMAFFDSRPSAEQWAKSSEGEAHFVDVAQRNFHRISGNG
jgi:hypothetical protein